MKDLLSKIKKCNVCEAHLPLGANPVVTAHPDSKIVIIGQTPGTKVHKTGIPWDDPSGKQLRKWLGVTDEVFYDETKIALIPMGFCYPGKGSSGDLPPRPECASLWHEPLLEKITDPALVILIGVYSQKHYLKEKAKKTLTETVQNYKDYLPTHFVLPHPSPRNRFWLTKNPWFEDEVVKGLRNRVRELI